MRPPRGRPEESDRLATWRRIGCPGEFYQRHGGPLSGRSPTARVPQGSRVTVAWQSAPAAPGLPSKENTVTSHLTRLAAALLTAVMMLSLFAASALAAVSAPPSGDISFAERGITAQAYSESCDEPDSAGVTRCESVQAYVFDGRQSSNDEFGHAHASLTYLCVYRQQIAFGEDGVPVEPPLIEQGCTDDPQLIVVDVLESLAAEAPALELAETICTYDPETGEESCELGDTRSVSVEVVFTGTGDLASQRWSSRTRSLVDGLRCTFASSGSGISREAAASLTIDGTTHELGFGQLSDGKTRFAQHCRD